MIVSIRLSAMQMYLGDDFAGFNSVSKTAQDRVSHSHSDSHRHRHNYKHSDSVCDSVSVRR